MAKANAPKALKAISDTIEVPVGYKLVMAKVPFDSKASRLETLIIRPIWSIPFTIVMLVYMIIYMIVVLVYSFVAQVLMCFNWLSSFFLARRLQSAFNWAAKALNIQFRLMTKVSNYAARRAPYFWMMTDKRPSLGMETEADKETTGSLA